jgi:hypothetical protein
MMMAEGILSPISIFQTASWKRRGDFYRKEIFAGDSFGGRNRDGGSLFLCAEE